MPAGVDLPGRPADNIPNLFLGPDMRTALVAALFLTAPAIAADDVKLENIDLDGLLRAVAAHKGEVVVVDVWGSF